MSRPNLGNWRRFRHPLVQVKNVLRSRWILRDCNELGHLARLGEGNAIIRNRGWIGIGTRTRLMGRYAPIELATGENGRLIIGDRTLVNYGTAIHAVTSVEIGDDVDIGPYCVISDTEIGGLDSPDLKPSNPIVIGSKAWLATRVIVRPGAVIGEGTVVAAGSVVEGVVPSHVVIAGSPARVVRHLDGAARNDADRNDADPDDADRNDADPDDAAQRDQV